MAEIEIPKRAFPSSVVYAIGLSISLNRRTIENNEITKVE